MAEPAPRRALLCWSPALGCGTQFCSLESASRRPGTPQFLELAAIVQRQPPAAPTGRSRRGRRGGDRPGGGGAGVGLGRGSGAGWALGVGAGVSKTPTPGPSARPAGLELEAARPGWPLRSGRQRPGPAVGEGGGEGRGSRSAPDASHRRRPGSPPVPPSAAPAQARRDRLPRLARRLAPRRRR